MIAVEKLRALCQQMQEYIPTGRTKRARARDFFDIFTIVTETGLRFEDSETRQLLEAVFAAKQVPTKLLGKIAEQRDFHRDDWPNVRTTVKGRLEAFDYYFNFVLDTIKPLESLWMV
jgi:hypothetical protein